MDLDADLATALGWPKLKYAQIERERRWLCSQVPEEWLVRSRSISDLYLIGTHLRLRAIQCLATGAIQYKLTRKADLSPDSRIITTIYLPEHEHDLLSRLPAKSLDKLRHSVCCPNGEMATVDVFCGSLEGLCMIEVEFESDAAMTDYQPPEIAQVEVTDDARYTGWQLASRGMPGGQ